MFEQLMAAMSKPTTQNGFDYAQRMMECTMRLTQAQMDVMKGLYDEVGQEFSKTMTSSSDQSALAKNWPQLMSNATRANAEAGALFMKNAQEYQSELLQMIKSTNPGLSAEFMKDLMGVSKTSPIANGGAALQAARAKKAA
jgi:hypothetical protein